MKLSCDSFTKKIHAFSDRRVDSDIGDRNLLNFDSYFNLKRFDECIFTSN